MKNIKLSRTSWLILSAGIFLVVLAGLGVTRNQQIQEQNVAQEKLDLSETRLNKFDTTQLRYSVEEVSRLIEEKKLEVEKAKERLDYTVVSADVVEQFFAIAQFSNVVVMDLSDTQITSAKFGGVDVFQTSLSGRVEGTLENVIDFIIDLNHNFTTGYTVTAQINVNQVEGGDDLNGHATGNVQLFVYSYEAAE